VAMHYLPSKLIHTLAVLCFSVKKKCRRWGDLVRGVPWTGSCQLRSAMRSLDSPTARTARFQLSGPSRRAIKEGLPLQRW